MPRKAGFGMLEVIPNVTLSVPSVDEEGNLTMVAKIPLGAVTAESMTPLVRLLKDDTVVVDIVIERTPSDGEPNVLQEPLEKLSVRMRQVSPAQAIKEMISGQGPKVG